MTALVPGSPEFFAREYNNRELVPEHPQIFADWARRSAEARSQLTLRADLAYDSGAAETLDLFPAQRKGAPLFVFIHGGYWRSLDKADFSFIAPPLVAAGVSVAVLNYGLCPSVTMDTIVLQNVRALAWLYRQAAALGFDARRIHVGGHSAGGHLTAMMMCARFPDVAPDLPADLVKSGLAVSGLYDLQPMVQTAFLNGDLKLDNDSAFRLSPAWMKPATDAPVMTAVGGDESSEFHRQNALLGQCWPDQVGDLAMPGCNHMTVIGELANPASALFKAALRLCQR